MSTMPQQKPGRSKQDYGTPNIFLTAVKGRLKIVEFSVDLAASPENAKANFYYTEEQNSLVQDWSQWEDQWLWLNPPFSKITPWVKKAYIESAKGANIAILVPASVGANWWNDWVANKCYVCFLHGRLTFEGETAPYPKDCALLIYTPFGFKGNEVWTWETPDLEGMV